MRPLPTIAAVLLLALAACGDGKDPDAAPAPGDAVPAENPRPVIDGRVYEGKEQAVPGASVHLRLPFGAGREGQDGLTVVTDERGRFTFDVEAELHPKTDSPVEISVTKEGYVRFHHRFPSQKPGRGFSVQVRLHRAGGLSGTVRDGAGKPVADAIVYAIQPDVVGVRRLVEVVHTLTGPDGSFRLQGLPPGKLDLGVKGEGFLTGLLRDVEVEPEKVPTLPEILLTRGKTIAGRVVLDGGKGPVDRAIVRVYQDPVLKDYMLFGRRGMHAAGGISRVDEEGRFRVTGLADGEWDVDAVTIGLAAVRGRVTGVAAGTSDVELVFTGSTRVKVAVRDAETGKPVPRFKLVITSLSGPRAPDKTPVATQEIDVHSPAGEYGFPGREGEHYGLEVVAEGYEDVRRSVGPLRGGPLTLVTVPLKRRE